MKSLGFIKGDSRYLLRQNISRRGWFLRRHSMNSVRPEGKPEEKISQQLLSKTVCHATGKFSSLDTDPTPQLAFSWFPVWLAEIVSNPDPRSHGGGPRGKRLFLQFRSAFFKDTFWKCWFWCKWLKHCNTTVWACQATSLPNWFFFFSQLSHTHPHREYTSNINNKYKDLLTVRQPDLTANMATEPLTTKTLESMDSPLWRQNLLLFIYV